MLITNYYPKFDHKTDFNWVSCFAANHPDHRPSLWIKNYRNGKFKWKCKSCDNAGYGTELELCELIKKGAITNKRVITSSHQTVLVNTEKKMPPAHYKLMVAFWKWSQQQLKQSPPIIKYLKGRKLPLKYFGYVPPASPQQLADELKVTTNELTKANLINQYGLYYKNRIIFLLWSHRYDLRGFVGRTVLFNNPQIAKYKNPVVNDFYSKNTVLFLESTVLKYLNNVADGTTVTLSICEGYLDAIALMQMKHTCVVAVGGTNFGNEYHIEFIKKCLATGKVEMVAYFGDHDDAGEKTAAKAITFLKKVAGDKAAVFEYSKNIGDHKIKDLNDLLIYGEEPFNRYFNFKTVPPVKQESTFDISALMIKSKIAVYKPTLPVLKSAEVKKPVVTKTTPTIKPVAVAPPLPISLPKDDDWNEIGKRIITIKNHADGCGDENSTSPPNLQPPVCNRVDCGKQMVKKDGDWWTCCVCKTWIRIKKN